MSTLDVRHEGATVVLTLNDPERRNVLSAEMCSALSRAVNEADADPEAKAILITGAGPAFCAGANLDDLEAASDGNTEPLRAVYQSFLDVANTRLPTIAAVNGAAVGAGFNLALACDMRIAGAMARFDPRFLQIGLHPGGGHSWMLLRAVGWAAASRMLLFGQSVGTDEALRIGLVQQVAEGDLIEAALVAARVAEILPRELLVATKATMHFAAVSDHSTTFEHETAAQLHSLGQPAFRELVSKLKRTIAER